MMWVVEGVRLIRVSWPMMDASEIDRRVCDRDPFDAEDTGDFIDYGDRS